MFLLLLSCLFFSVVVAADIQPAQHTESLHSRRLAIKDSRKTSSNFFDLNPHCEKLGTRYCDYAAHNLGSGEEFANWKERTQHVYTNMARMDPLAFQQAPYGMSFSCASETLPPLYWWSELTQAARFHSHEMAAHDWYGHSTAPQNADLFKGTQEFSTRIKGFLSSDEGTNRISENAARGTALGDPRIPTRGWLKSKAHCQGIFDKSKRYLGVGYFFNSTHKAKHHWSQNFFLGPELPKQYIVAGTHETTTGTNRFLVQVYMPQAPSKVVVVIGCAVHTMSLLLGTAKAGTYYVDVDSMSGADTDGCVPYYFDVDSGAAVMPADRSYHFLTYGVNNCKRNIGKGSVHPLGWHVCTCPNGNARTGATCPSNGALKCASCNKGFSIRSNGQCVQNVCTCPNGTPKTGTGCTAHGGVMCSKCTKDVNVAVVLDENTGKCRATVCICPNGTPVTGVNCFEDDALICDSCRPGFKKSYERSCKPEGSVKLTKCTCPFGEPETDFECPANDPGMCVSCNAGYKLTRVKFAYKCNADVTGNLCTCPNGNPATNDACPSNGALKCVSCKNSGYHLTNGKCVQNVCKCPDGVAAGQTLCKANGAEACASCDTGYRLIKDKCVAKVCKCPNGTAYTDTGCTVHGRVNCQDCNKGYRLISGLTNGGWDKICIGELEEDPSEVCTCPNGKADNGDACFNSKSKKVLCASCDAGYSLVNGLCTNVKVSMCRRGDKKPGITTAKSSTEGKDKGTAGKKTTIGDKTTTTVQKGTPKKNTANTNKPGTDGNDKGTGITTAEPVTGDKTDSTGDQTDKPETGDTTAVTSGGLRLRSYNAVIEACIFLLSFWLLCTG